MNRKKWLNLVCILLFLALLVGAIAFRDQSFIYILHHPYHKIYHTENTMGQLTVREAFHKRATIDITVDEISVREDETDRGFLCSGQVKLTLVAKKDISFDLVLSSQNSPDNIAGGSGIENMTLKKGVPETVTMGFGGWKHGGYYLNIYTRGTESRSDRASIIVYIGFFPDTHDVM